MLVTLKSTSLNGNVYKSKPTSTDIMAHETNVTQLNLSLDENEFTSYEKARMIGSRALQISQGAAPLIKLTKKDIDNLSISKGIGLDKSKMPSNCY